MRLYYFILLEYQVSCNYKKVILIKGLLAEETTFRNVKKSDQEGEILVIIHDKDVQVLKYVLLRRPTPNLIIWYASPADKESHIFQGRVCLFCYSRSKLICGSKPEILR
jgi:hypothetical protein